MGTQGSGKRVEVKGVKELVRKLKKLDKDLVKRVKEINKAAAEMVAADARARAPRQTGALANSVRAGATQYSGVVRVGGAKVPYAAPIIYGWGSHNIRPQPFIYAALDARRADVYASYEASVSELVAHIFPGGI